MSFSQKVKALRGEKGWSQADLGSRLGIQREQVSNYERDQSLPNTDVLIKLARALDVSIDYLLFDDHERSPIRVDVKDTKLFEQFEELDKAGENDRKLIRDLAETVLWKIRLQKMVSQGPTID